MTKPKSPFMVYRHLLSPKICETIVNNLEFYYPDVDINDKPIKMYRSNEHAQSLVWDRYEPLIDEIAKYYDFSYRGTEQMMFEYLAQGTRPDPICENSNYLKKKWVRTKDRDITCLIFLCDYNNQPPFDTDFETYGGKLEFPQHQFGFNPERGTMIVYPSGPHFINANAAVHIGDLIQVRFHIAAKLPYLYDPRQFPGNYQTWFKDLL